MVSFTHATLPDLPAFIALQQEFYAAENLQQTSTVIASARSLLSDPALGLITFIRTNNTLAGYFVLTYGFSLERSGRFALLDELFVLPAFRNQGLGRSAVARAIDLARQNGCHSLHLEADHAKPHLAAFYQSLGFTVLARHYLTLDVASFLSP